MKSELLYDTAFTGEYVYRINRYLYIYIREFDDAGRVFIWTISEITIVFVEVIKSKRIKGFKPYIIIKNKYSYSEMATNPLRMTTMRSAG